MGRPKKLKLKSITLHEVQTAVWEMVKIRRAQDAYTITFDNDTGMFKAVNADGVLLGWVNPPYAKDERVYIREPYFWWIDHYVYKDSPQAGNVPRFNPSTRMPESAARKFAVCIGVEVVRCHDVSNEQLIAMGYTSFGIPIDVDKYKSDIITKHGQKAWDDNHYIFISSFKTEPI